MYRGGACRLPLHALPHPPNLQATADKANGGLHVSLPGDHMRCEPARPTAAVRGERYTQGSVVEPITLFSRRLEGSMMSREYVYPSGRCTSSCRSDRGRSRRTAAVRLSGCDQVKLKLIAVLSSIRTIADPTAKKTLMSTFCGELSDSLRWSTRSYAADDECRRMACCLYLQAFAF